MRPIKSVPTIPRSEYPRPQFARDDWQCLNGEWQFEIDAGDSGLERGLLSRELSDRISVPFCPESPLSGVGNPDFMNSVWYRRTVGIPREWAGRRVLLHFQAVDYDATVWVNGREVARHRGGFTPFSCDLAGVVDAGATAVIVVRARDDHRAIQPRGKQCPRYRNFNCFYTRTTGIWQTVWMEPVPRTAALCRPRITPMATHRTLRVAQPIEGKASGMQVRVVLSDSQQEVCTASCLADADFCPTLDLKIPENLVRFWSPEHPFLYDIRIELVDSDGSMVDSASSYAGLRSIGIEGPAVKINGRTVFQRLVLDQGYYPEGVLTAPSDEALKHDIQLAQAAGFNGARLHQKIFEERYLYHADRLGYLVWGEFPDWGCQNLGPEDDHVKPTPSYLTEWLEVIERDYSHPCIVGWCPLNETGQPLSDRITALDVATRGLFLATKASDRTRPVLDASGYSHRVRETDVYDCHDYEQDPARFAAKHAPLTDGRPFVNCGAAGPWSIPWRGQPFFVSEFGGIWWNPQVRPGEDSWPTVDRIGSIDEFYERFAGLCTALIDNPSMFGYCYTQLTDVYQEHNGIYTFSRAPKFDLDRLRAIQQRPAAIERLFARDGLATARAPR